jgi:endonuclease/exonuclease/phosphatase (EEP) superfamily protein YafD
VLCLRTNAAGAPVLACVLHTVTGNPTKARQVAAAAAAVNAESLHGPVILGGDFNTTPGGMGALLDPARGGRFFDVDPQRAATRGSKIDYVLFDRGHFSNPSGGPQGSPYSDHDALQGQATRS